MKLKIFVFISLILFFASCGSKKKVVNNRNSNKVIVEAKPIKLPSVNESKIVKKLKINNPYLNPKTLAYIKKYASIAVQEMHEYKIPASITLAQGILESGNGKSQLAVKSNNHFGIKCHTGWQGERVYHDDDKKGECFRKYTYPETSFKDHSLFLTKRSRYAFLFDYHISDYKKWAYGLRKAGYATDRKYPSKLLKLIKDYKLYKFDNIKKSSYQKEIKKRNKKTSKKKPYITKKVKQKFYVVTKGDTLYALSKKFNISIDTLKRINNLQDTNIAIGQKLLIK